MEEDNENELRLITDGIKKGEEIVNILCTTEILDTELTEEKSHESDSSFFDRNEPHSEKSFCE
jgi:hypothetical protein